MYTDELKFICNKKGDKYLEKSNKALTNLVARMRKLTFKHNLTHVVTLMKDTVLYPFPGRMASRLKLTESEMSI